MRGRKPKDEALKDASGRPGKRAPRPRATPEEPATAPLDAYTAPQQLPTRAKAVWQREVWRLREMSFTRPSDLATFADYCRHQSLVEQCDAVLAEGLTYETVSKHGSMRRAHPEFDMRTKAARLAMDCLKQLGLTTLSRLRGRAISGQLDMFPGGAHRPAAEPARPAASPDSPIGFVN
jgi:P27 family predicted phage terminase small subunit